MRNHGGGALNASRRIALVATAMAAVMTPIVAGAMAFGQNRQGQPAGAAQQAPLPRFEVVSVKPRTPEPTDGPTLAMPGAFLPGGTSPPDSATTRRFLAGNATLEEILHRAYPEFAQPNRLIAPDWIADARFDIDGRAGTDVPVRLMRQMLRQLLVDRFAMQSHTEMRLVDIYHLVLARGDGKRGPRLRSASGVCDKWNAQMAADGLGDTPPPQPKQSAGAPPCGTTAGIRPGTYLRTLLFGGVELSDLATMLSGFVETSVTNRTGLTGRFDIDLTWADAPLDAQDAGPSLANALEEQLGLKLQREKGVAEVLVVNRIERPTAN
jgi:uncharacterized protein (TIGR03435 family)